MAYALNISLAPLPQGRPVANDLNLSASQVKTWNLCRRKWAMFKIYGIKEREKQHFVIGHALHACAERYLLGQATSWEGLFPTGWDKGLAAEEATWIRDMARYAVEKGLWQVIPSAQVEYPLALLVGRQFLDARGMPFLAKAETYLDDGGVRRVAKLVELANGQPLPTGWNQLPPFVGFVDNLDLWGDPPGVFDHKSAKNRRYAMTSEKLAHDLQMLSYSTVPLILRPEVEKVKLRHNIFLKDPSAKEPAYSVEAEATVESVRNSWADVIQAAEDMALLREVAPRLPEKHKRADNWIKVKGAIEDGRAQESCNAFGGCPFRDMCYGRCTAEQMIHRMDSPDTMPLVQAAIKKFSLNVRTTQAAPAQPTNPRPQDETMPFPIKPAPLTAGTDAYVLDPENAETQFRVRVLSADEATGNANLAIYPNADITPAFEQLGPLYRIDMPISSIMRVPHIKAKITGYQDALKAAGITEGAEWTAAQAAPAPTPAASLAQQPKETKKPKGDDKFKLNIPAVPAATVPHPLNKDAAEIPKALAAQIINTNDGEPLPAGAPEWAVGAAEGMQLRVLPNIHPFWVKHANRIATIANVSAGEAEGSVLLDIEIGGLPFPGVNAHRFEPVVLAAPELPTEIQARCRVLCGQVVVLKRKSTANELRGELEAATETEIVFLNGNCKIAYDDVVSIDPMKPGDIPGAPAPKPPKAVKAKPAPATEAAPPKAPLGSSNHKPTSEAAPAQAAGTAPTPAPAPPGASDPAKSTGNGLAGQAQMDTKAPPCLVGQAIEAIQAALNGGKVTRKVLEGVLPLLQQAQKNGYWSGVTEIPPGVPAAPAGDPQLRGVVSVALDHAIAVLTDARGKIA